MTPGANDMHVVHVICTGAFAGAERYVQDSAISLVGAGCRVTVIGGSKSRMLPALRAAGADWMPGRNAMEATGALLRVGRPDVINTHLTAADVVGVTVGGLRGVPVISTRHIAAERGSNPLSRLVSRGVARRVGAQLAVSQFVAENIDGPSIVVHTGVQDSVVEDVEREPIVLVAQRFEAEKHTALALDAWSRIADHEPWRLVIAGDGSEREGLRQRAHDLGISDSVDFVGFRSDVDELLGRASIFFATTPREGLGLSVIEAMAHGVPTVAAGAGGHLESVGGVEDPALFGPDDAGEAARQLSRLMHSADERRRYGAALRDRQRERFTRATQTAATLRLFHQVLEQAR